jgi:type II secretory pathway pseudopilin PulG
VPADVTRVTRDGSPRPEGGSITTVEASVLGVMAAVILAIGVPSYLAMRDRSSDAAARTSARQAAAAVEEYRAAHGSLSGIAPAVLRRYDAELDPASFRLRVSGSAAYCVESSSGGREWHLAGPSGSLARGSCP